MMGIGGMPWDQPWSGIGQMAPGMKQGQQGWGIQQWLQGLGLPMTQLMMEQQQNAWQGGEAQRRFNSEQEAAETEAAWGREVRFPGELKLRRDEASMAALGAWGRPNVRYL